VDWRPGADLDTLRQRAGMLAGLRAFFAARGVLEVETPALGAATVTDVHLASLVTRVGPHGAARYLQTSPEYAMKRLLAAGSGDIYQVCRAFRDDAPGRLHHLEFTMVEWYRVGFDHRRLMDEVAALLGQLLGARWHAPAEVLSYREAFERELGIDPMTVPLATLAAVAEARLGPLPAGLDVSPGGLRDGCLDLLMGAVVGPALGHERVCFVHEYPASQAALARLLPGQPPVAARFEAYVEGIELCNGFHELADAAEQRHRFEADLAARAARALPRPPLDERLLAALAAGLPDCAGVALGFDRLVMLATGRHHIREVLAFAADEA
jgi:elongation factor P--(R)-beta-lysine ligase